MKPTILLIISFFLFSCVTDPPTQTEREYDYGLKVEVLDTAHAPISDIECRLLFPPDSLGDYFFCSNATTDSAGKANLVYSFRYTTKNTPPEYLDLVLRVYNDSFQSCEHSVQVYRIPNDYSFTVSLCMEPYNSYHYTTPLFVVQDSLDGSLLPGVRIVGGPWGPRNHWTTTDDAGEAYMVLNYWESQGSSVIVDFTFSHPSYVTKTLAIECKSGSDPGINIKEVFLVPK